MSRYHLKNDNADLASLTEQIKRLNEEKERQAKEAQTVTQSSGPATTTALRQSRTSLTTILLLGVAALIMLTIVAFGVGRLFPGLFAGGGATRQVPAIIGKKETEAKMAVAREGLRPVVKYISNSKSPVGSIISTEPKPGSRLKPGSDVVMRVASKPQKPVVKETAGTEKKDPTTPRETTETPRETPKPLTETPKPDAQPQPATNNSTTVAQTNTNAASAPALTSKVAVPDVEGMIDTKATQLLAKAGLKAVITQGQDSSVPERIVLKSDPKPGATLEPGSLVNIVVNASSAPASTSRSEVRTPLKNYIGLNGLGVYNELRAQGFTVTYEYQETTLQKSGLVVRTLPPAGTSLAPRSEVKLIIAK